MGTTTIAEFGTYGMTETFRHEIDRATALLITDTLLTSRTKQNGLEL